MRKAIIIIIVLLLSLGSIGVSYAKWKDLTFSGNLKPIETEQCSDPFTWAHTNDDGVEDWEYYLGNYIKLDPGDNGTYTEYRYWQNPLIKSSNDPGSYPEPESPPEPGDNFPRYTKDVARTWAEINTDNLSQMTVTVENAYPYYYATVFFAFECPESRRGWIRNFELTPLSGPDTWTYIEVSETLLELDQEIPAGGEVVGALHIFVTQEAAQNATYQFLFSINTECRERECGTAYAYGGEDTDAICFTTLGFKKWGWTNGPLGEGHYVWPLWEGAAKCDLTKGTLVGEVTIDYDGSTAWVTFDITDPDYAMDQTHVYVGNDQLPTDENGDPTVAPGQYPYGHTHGPNETLTYTYEIEVSGEIYVIAHAVPCWYE